LPTKTPKGFTAVQTTAHFSITIPSAQRVILDVYPRIGPLRGGTDVRITVSGLYIAEGEETTAKTKLPSVNFGPAPATYVSILTSDVYATVMIARAPPRADAGIVRLEIEGNLTDFTYAYASEGTTAAAAVCVSHVCEVDAVAGGTLRIRTIGVRVVSAQVAVAEISSRDAVINNMTLLVSFIVSYDIELFDAASKMSVYARTRWGLVDSAFAMGLNLTENRSYFARVYAINSVELETFADSDIFIIQTTPPVLEDVYGKFKFNMPACSEHLYILTRISV
jgi:hypothetical protein